MVPLFCRDKDLLLALTLVSHRAWRYGVMYARGSRTRHQSTHEVTGPLPSAHSARGSGPRRNDEPGWAGADRAAGWGRGGGRALRAGRGRGHQSLNPASKTQPRHESTDRGAGRRQEAGGERGAAESAREGRAGRHGAGNGAGRGAGGGASHVQGTAGSGLGGGAEGTRAKSDEGTLHGSWAAKRALKEKEASATTAFSGKRIQFDEDDD